MVKLHDVAFDYTKSKQIEGNEQGGYCRSHLFPVWSLREILQSCDGYFKNRDKSSLSPEDRNFIAKLGRATGKGKFKRDKNPLADLIPYMVLPKAVEKGLNSKIRDYVTEKSDTGEESSNITIKGTSAIADDSQFAKQHPHAYLAKFEELVVEYANTLPENDQFTVKVNLRRGMDAVKDLSNTIERLINRTHEGGLFGVNPEVPAGTQSGQRQVKDPDIFRPVASKVAKNQESSLEIDDGDGYSKNSSLTVALSPTGSPKTSRSSSPSVPIVKMHDGEESDFIKKLGAKRNVLKNTLPEGVEKLAIGSVDGITK